jgi:hypothetical protein
MSIAAVMIEKEGISTRFMAEQVLAELKARGRDVVSVLAPYTNFARFPMAELHQKVVFNFCQQHTPAILQAVRYTHPRQFISVFFSHWLEYELPFHLAYAAVLAAPKFHGVPVAHVAISQSGTEDMLKTWRETLSPSLVRRIQPQMHTIRFGVEPEFQPGENVPDLLVVPSNRFSKWAKDLTLHGKVTRTYLAWAASKGLQPQVMFYYAPGFGPEKKSYAKDFDCYTFIPQPASRDEYRANAALAGMFLSTSTGESFGLYYLELLCSGAVGVFLDAAWVRNLLPGYPFVAPAAHLADMMAAVRTGYDEARAHVLEHTIPFIRRTYSIPAFVDGLEALSRELT